MIAEPKLLTQGTPDAGASFNFDAYAAELKAKPKEIYQEAIDPEPEPPPPPPPGPDPKAEEKQAQEDNSTARFLVDMYDGAVSKICEAIVDEPERYPSARFRMEPLLKQQAETQLEKGLAEGGMLRKIPWWVALMIVIAFHGGVSWWAVRGAKRERKQREEHKPTTPGQAVPPTTIYDKHGHVVRPAAPPPPAPPAPPPATPPPSAPPPSKPLKVFGACLECGAPVHKRGRMYCSQSCSGKASSKKKQAAKRKQAEPTAPLAPVTA